MKSMVERNSVLFYGPPVSLISPRPGGLYLFFGDPALTLLAPRLIAWRLAQDERVLFLDGDNRFNPYPIVDLAKRLGKEPKDFLSAIFVSRAATCHQMATLITRQLPAAIVRYRCRLAVIASPLQTFYDEAVPFAEAKNLLSRAIPALKEAAREGVWIILLAPLSSRSGRPAAFLPMLKRAADRIFSVSGEEELLIREEDSPNRLQGKGK